ncbi:thioredoxin-domain-containing protein [Daedaleopsis nitida]|nr:thioredoxin-domain-containing protein [Daedaleopsis nitida]
MAKPIPVESVSHWNTALRAAKEKGQPIFVDFFATWCGPCKVIAPVFEQLAAQYPAAVFLKVDVDRLQQIAAKYNVTAMPTFYVIRESGPVDSVRGADSRGLAAMVAKHASSPPNMPSGPALPAEAEKAKTEGNTAFARGEYERAIEHYSRAIEVAPKSAVLYGNRALAYIKLIKSGAPTKEERQLLRPKAVKDARQATVLDERWGKGWVRMAEALLLTADEEENESVKEEARQETVKKCLEGVESALENAIGLSEGKVKAGEALNSARVSRSSV